MLPFQNLIYAALLGYASVSATTPNKPGSQYQYPFAVPYDQAFLGGYSPLKHIGGFGPYSNRQSYGIGRDPPAGCKVDQVFMVRRHGERYPLASDTAGMKAVIAKMRSQVHTFQDDLDFFNTWKFYVEDGYVGLETYSGPYDGLLTSYKNGAEYRVRYGHLFDQFSSGKIPMWAAENERVLQTARKFGEGFFGWNYTNVVAMNLVSQSGDMGANSLTPSCPADKGGKVCNSLPATLPQLCDAAERLNKQNSGLRINASDVFYLMEMGAMELPVRGHSKWIDVFTLDEWIAFGYLSALDYYWCWGPGNRYSTALGGIWANATLTLMNEGPERAHKMYWTFSHDVNIIPILAALGISTPREPLPLDRIPFPNEYNIGDVMPMGTHLTIERLQCDATAVTEKDTYVRLVLNEAVVPFANCTNGPGFSCSLANYTTQVKEMVPDYASTCGLNSTWPHHLSFFWDYNTTTTWDYQTQQFIPFRGKPVV